MLKLILKKVYLWIIELSKLFVFSQIIFSWWRFNESLFFWSVCLYFTLEYIKNLKKEFQYARSTRKV